MKRVWLLCAVLAVLSTTGHAGPIPIGFASWDVTFPGNSGQVDDY